MSPTKLSPLHSSIAAGFAVLAGFLILFAAPFAFAATNTWDITPGDGATITPGSGTWLNGSGNWNNGVTDVNWNNATPDLARFAGADGTYAITVGGAITIGPGTKSSLAGGLVFANSGYTLSASGAQKVSVGSGTAEAYIDFASGTTNTIGNNVTLGKGGTGGTIFLLGGGTLQITPGGTFTNAGTAALEVAEASTLWINGGTVSLGGSISLGKLLSGNAEGPSGNLLVDSGALTIGGAGNFAVGRTTGDSCTATLNGGTITAVNGNLNFGLAGTPGNGTVNLNGGTLTVKAVTEQSTAVISTLNFNGGTLKAQVATTTFMNGLDFAQIRTNSAIINPNGLAITIGQILQHSTIFDDPPTDGGLTLANSTGTGTLTLNGANTFNGPTKITTGLLSLGNSLALQNSPLDTLNSVAGDANNGFKTTLTSLTLGGLTGNKDLASVFATAGYVTVANLTLNPGTGATPSYSGNIANGASGMTLTKSGDGTQTLTGANSYTGATIISGGTLALSGSGMLATPSISIDFSATLDVSAQTPPTLAASQNLLGTGSVKGNLTTVATTAVYPGTDGTPGTLTFNNNLTLHANTQVQLDLDSVYYGANDLIVLNGTGAVLTPNNAQIIIKSAGTLDTTADYLLIDLTGSGASFSGSFNASPGWAGVTPANSANYTVVTSGTQVTLHYSAGAALSGVGSATPASVTHGQAPLLTVTVTAGTSPASTGIAVKANLSSVGGSSAQTLYDNGSNGDVTAGDNIFSYNGYTIPAGTSLGAKSFSATITDAQSRNATANIGLTVVPATVTWGAAPTTANWGTAANWVTGFSPGAGDLVYFDASTQLSPNLETGYSVDSVTFNSGAGGYTIGGSALTLTGNGVTNSSANAQTLNVAVVMGASQTIDAASGDVTLGGVVSGSGKSLTKVGPGTLTLSAANSYNGVTTISAGKLALSGSGSLGNAANPLVLEGGQLDLNGASRTVGAVSVTAPAASGDTLTNGTLTGTSYAVSSTTDTTTISANLLGSGGFAKSGAGTVVLSGNNSFSGPSSINEGKVSLQHANALGATGIGNRTTISSANSSGIELLGGISYAPEDLTMAAGGAVVHLRSVSGNNTWNGAIDNSGVSSSTYGRIQSDTNTLTLAGTMTGTSPNLGFVLQGEGNILVSGQITGSSGLTSGSTGAGTRTLSNPANDFTANVSINGGTLKLGASGVIPDGTGKGNVAVTGTGMLDLNGYSETINGLSGAGIVDNTATNTTSTLTVGGNNQTSTFSGVITNTAGTLALAKIGSGKLTLSGANTYTGNTTISAGTLVLGNDSALTLTSGLIIAAGATLDTVALTMPPPETIPLTASGTGTNIGTTAATIIGVSDFPHDLGARHITLNYDGANPALYLAGGTLNLSNNPFTINGSILANGVHTIIAQSDAPDITGSVAASTVNGTALIGKTGTVSLAGNTVVLTVSGAGPVGPATLTNSVSGGVLSLSWPAAQGWRLQQQTNSLSIGLSTNWVYVTDGSVSSTNIPVNTTQPAVFYRLTYP